MDFNELKNKSNEPITGSTSAITDGLFPKGKRKILTLFFLHPDKRFYYREVIRLIGSTPGPVLRELRALTKAGILEVEPIGIQKFYKANRDCPIFSELRGIVQKTFGIANVLAETLKAHEDKIRIALIYGSVATGEDTAKSDIDLLVVGSLSFRELSLILSDVEGSLNRPVNPTLYSVEQFAGELAANNHFIKSVLSSKVIYLIGSKDAAEGLA